jgi:FixJ family two-component response regulator
LTDLFSKTIFEGMIYIIDDNVNVRRALETLLESAELEHKSFESANSFLSGEMPTVNDLVVLDINMPEINGLDTLKKFSEENRFIPVIVVTASDDEQIRECCRKYGVKAFLRKPVDGEARND